LFELLLCGSDGQRERRPAAWTSTARRGGARTLFTMRIWWWTNYWVRAPSARDCISGGIARQSIRC